MPLTMPDQKRHLRSHAAELIRLKESVHKLFHAKEAAEEAYLDECANRDNLLDKIRQYAGASRPLVVVGTPTPGHGCLISWRPHPGSSTVEFTTLIMEEK